MLKYRRTIGLLLAIAFVAGGVGYWHHKRFKHWAVHDPGMVYRSAWLEADAMAEQIEKYQIRTVLNLCNPDEMGPRRASDERRAVEGAGARLLELPLPAETIDASDPQANRVVEALADPQNYPLLVHCQHGVTRTAKVLAIYDILYRNQTAVQSIDAMPRFGRSDYSVSVRAFANDFEKRHRELYPQAEHRLGVLR